MATPVPEILPLLCRHNERDDVSNHQPHDCLLIRSCRPRSKKTLNLRVTGLCAGNSPVTGEFPAQTASNAENVSILWRHHAMNYLYEYIDPWGSLWYYYISITKQTMPKHLHISWVMVYNYTDCPEKNLFEFPQNIMFSSLSGRYCTRGINTLTLSRRGRHFAGAIFLNRGRWILRFLKFILKSPINNSSI